MRIVYFVLSLITSHTAFAQAVPSVDPGEDAKGYIIVNAPRTAGSAIGDIPAEIELNEAAIESYGASNLADLLTALAPQTGSGRGRGGGAPVVLINGRRVAGFAEIRDLPSEAIEKVQVLPEEVALKYGFAADQRVVNFILKPGFQSVALEIEQAEPIKGGRGESEATANVSKITKTGRITFDATYQRATALTEAERGITPSSGAATAPFRTLLPKSEDIRFNATINRALTDIVAVTVNGRYEQGDRQSLLGLLSGTTQAIARDVGTDTLHGAITLDGSFSRWQWSATSNIDQDRSTVLTDVNAVTARDVTISKIRSLDGVYTLSGPLIELPAGAVRVSARAGFDSKRLRTRSQRSLSGSRTTRLARDEANARVNLDIPLANRDRGVAGALGKLSLNANAGYRRLSDFGRITSFGYGLNWEPVEGMTILASSLNEQSAPTIQQLGDAALVTPGVSIYDFTRAQTVIIDRISGGNSGLVREERRDLKAGISYQPPSLKLITVSANYFRNRSINPSASFPVLTPDSERAFPERFVRDANGALISFDTRAINYARTSSDQLRLGFNLSKEFGQPAGGRGAEQGARSPRQGGGGFGRGGFGGGPGSQGGRWQASLYHTLKFRDDVLIRPGVPLLDLLGGSAIGNNGGALRHLVEAEGGWFNKGLGFRLIGKYESGTRVAGDVPASSLTFSDLFTLNARFFVNFDSRKDVVKRIPFLKASRIALRIDNITGAIRDVRDGTGAVPLRYQSGYIDPRGRVVELSFRKRF